jgi:transketolase C-terminal domain/subunit
VVAALRNRVPEDWASSSPSAEAALPDRRKRSGHAQAFGDALQALTKSNPRVLALDGDVKNSTHSDEFLEAAPERFVEGYIAEQNIVGMSMGLAARGAIPFASTFALLPVACLRCRTNFTVLYPSDATSAWAATMLALELAPPRFVWDA